ncbi:pyridoxamine 5'-phosphate oxidase family protein [Actinoplanes sp. LDG1-06]|uniref:Pyridoxamine 5'-phosphate oxidase family protein n=1 Tax=Paractinoplanes ovalisporus TaxID=2810368 RepID=A0ABS2A622_9ACTN|nr:pyridoxamine 5'-phosphate oxidase family protein [Actinoplanes ovalisporus]MBM2614734.1 pyridoxamine 5'-phosphate oxidase family protein [Actinoplanes ovalisporus]
MLSDDDLALLSRPLYAFLTVAPGAGRWPAPRPVWFGLSAGNDIEMFSDPGAPKVQRLRDEPRASVVVAAPAGEPEHWVSVEGEVTLHDDGADLAARLADRYYDMTDPAHQQLLASWQASGMVRIVLRPLRVNRFAA